MSAKQDRLDLAAVVAALSPEQRGNLEERARLLGFPPGSWTALAGELTVALSWASTAVAADLRVFNPTWSRARAIDEAETTLLRESYGDQLASPPKSVRATYKRWAEAADPPSE